MIDTTELPEAPLRIDTLRLVIRCPRPADASAYSEAVNGSRESLRRWMPWAHEPSTVEHYQGVCARMQAAYLERSDFAMGLFLRRADGGEGPLIGGSGLHRIDWTVRRFEIGYWCRTGYTGRGLITEAVKAIAAMAFESLGARRVEIRHDDRNERSRRLAERAGFTFEGVLRQDSLGVGGAVRDTRVHSRVRGIEVASGGSAGPASVEHAG